MTHRNPEGVLPFLVLGVVACGEGVIVTSQDAGAPADSGGGPADAEVEAGADAGDVDTGAGDSGADDVCEPVPGAGPYVEEAVVPLEPNPLNLGAATDPNTNAKLRGSRCAPSALELYRTFGAGGPADPIAPKLYTLFEPFRVPALTATYAVGLYEGIDAGIEDSPPHLVGLETSPGEVLHAPALDTDGTSDYAGINLVVSFADEDSITLHYNNIDHPAEGYRIHIFGVCVEPTLLDLYGELMAAGRTRLPGLRNKQPFGRAAGTEIWVAIRDAGDWLDPRWIEDWWANGPGLAEPLPDRFAPPARTVTPAIPPGGTDACP